MIPKHVRTAFYALSWPFTTVNGVIFKHFRAPKNGDLRVHLGPGRDKYINGWINLDANMFTGKCDAWIDLRNKLPFHDQTVAAFYSHHVIEHLPKYENHLKDVFRCLRPGGVYRLGGPSGDSAIRKFQENDAKWFADFPDKRRSIGGRLENYIFCRQEHITILTFSFLEELLQDAGFEQIEKKLPIRESSDPETFSEVLKTEWESDFDAPHTLIIECRKPAVQASPRPSQSMTSKAA